MWRVGKVVALHDETATARTISLEVKDWPNHVAGQHVDVRLTASDGYSTVRSYSIASAPDPQGRIELTVERLPNGEVSPYLTQELAVGDRLELRGPIGGWFVWRTEQTEAIMRNPRIVPGDCVLGDVKTRIELSGKPTHCRRVHPCGPQGPVAKSLNPVFLSDKETDGMKFPADASIRRESSELGKTLGANHRFGFCEWWFLA